MVNLICGPIGCGKTQKLIDHANNELKKTKGLIVFIDRSDKLRLNIDKQIRFINAKEFSIDNSDKFFGFLCGIISGNYDINRIYIDNIKTLANLQSKESINQIISKINELSGFNEVEFYITLDSPDVDKIDKKEYQTV